MRITHAIVTVSPHDNPDELEEHSFPEEWFDGFVDDGVTDEEIIKEALINETCYTLDFLYGLGRDEYNFEVELFKSFLDE